MGAQRQTDLPVRPDRQSWLTYHHSSDHESRDNAPTTSKSSVDGNPRYRFDELDVHRSDRQRILIVHDRSSGQEMALRFTPLEYAVLVPLIERFGQPVATTTLYQAAFAMPCMSRDDRRLYRHIDRIRPKLSPLGLVIRSVSHHGYVLLKVQDEGQVWTGR
ncbi:MAG TPA: helix-turn-helix domain-containing protein [Ktedonobacterales bacterium]|jgi:DNA-binding response OmpR family regulator